MKLSNIGYQEFNEAFSFSTGKFIDYLTANFLRPLVTIVILNVSWSLL